MVASALYRYYPSRDDLLTALIIDAYDAVGEVAERAVAVADGRVARDQWVAACHAIRGWATAHRHEYALIYGSPVPGYRAPQDTVGPAARVPLSFVRVLAGASERGELAQAATAVGGTGISGELAGQVASLSAAVGIAGLPPEALVRGVIAWTQLFGMISWELFGQFVGSFEPADALFAHAVEQLASFVGLRQG
jgi:AcrR family transcriptional regulator